MTNCLTEQLYMINVQMAIHKDVLSISCTSFQHFNSLLSMMWLTNGKMITSIGVWINNWSGLRGFSGLIWSVFIAVVKCWSWTDYLLSSNFLFLLCSCFGLSFFLIFSCWFWDFLAFLWLHIFCRFILMLEWYKEFKINSMLSSLTAHSIGQNISRFP